jgi:DNA-directed RNA polymerase subunit RPC12/RpoP
MESKIECIHCGKEFAIPSYVNTDDFTGDIRCRECKALLTVQFKGSFQPRRYSLKKPPESLQPITLNFVPAEEVLKDKESA